jgi:hypothetical protein
MAEDPAPPQLRALRPDDLAQADFRRSFVDLLQQLSPVGNTQGSDTW